MARKPSAEPGRLEEEVSKAPEPVETRNGSLVRAHGQDVGIGEFYLSNNFQSPGVGPGMRDP